MTVFSFSSTSLTTSTKVSFVKGARNSEKLAPESGGTIALPSLTIDSPLGLSPLLLLISGFLFKVLVALVDTPFLYLGVYLFRRKFSLKVNEEINID